MSSIDQSFLVRTDQTKPASVDTTIWPKIFLDRSLTLGTDEKLQKKDDERSEGDVILTWAPGNGLLQYDFSSERNSSYFQSSPTTDADLNNTANVGDGFKCMFIDMT